MESKEYNLDAFKGMLGDDFNELKQMLLMFVNLTPEVINEMKDSAIQKDWNQVGNLAHKIKSSLRLLGMDSLVAIAIEIEREGHQQINVDNLAQKINNFSIKVLEIIELIKIENDLI